MNERGWFERERRDGTHERVTWRELQFREKNDVLKSLALLGYILPTSLYGLGHAVVGLHNMHFKEVPACSAEGEAPDGGTVCYLPMEAGEQAETPAIKIRVVPKQHIPVDGVGKWSPRIGFEIIIPPEPRTVAPSSRSRSENP